MNEKISEADVKKAIMNMVARGESSAVHEDAAERRARKDAKYREDYKNAQQKQEIDLDKIRGCMLGGAAGDALGYPVEFMGEHEIFKTYGKAGITEYDLKFGPVIGEETGKALISDDTQMSLFTATGMLVGHTRGAIRGIMGPVESYVRMAYNDWYYTQTRKRCGNGCSWLVNVPELYHRRAPGGTCLLGIQQGKPVEDKKGCGGIMRVAPVALLYRHTSPQYTAELCGKVAYLTHGHSLGYMPAAALGYILHCILDRDCTMSLKEIVMKARDAMPVLYRNDPYLPELTRIINLAIELSENSLDDLTNIHRIGEGWVAEETLGISLYCALRHQDDFSTGITAAVNHNGDSDSTGAVTGNILGAWLGHDAIEDKWKENLELSGVILEIADDLCHGCCLDEYTMDADPDWLNKYWYISKSYKNCNT